MAKGYSLVKNLNSSHFAFASACLFLLAFSGCLQQGATSLSSPAVTTHSGTISTASTSDMGVRIYLRNSPTNSTSYSNASFRQSATGSTYTDDAGESHSCSSYPCEISAYKYFKTDGLDTELQTRPEWLSGVYVGVTNAPSSGSACAKFNATTEAAVAHSFAGPVSVNVQGADGYYRVSEKDCGSYTTATGYKTDVTLEPLQIRVELNRSKLASNENIMVSLEYSAHSLAPNFTDSTSGLSPENCLTSISGNSLANSACAVFLWQMFVHPPGQTDNMAPFYNVIPPITNISNSTQSTSNGSLVQTKQIIVPLSAIDSTNSIIQISRTRSNLFGTNTTCENNSPLCNGAVFYSLTLYRM